MGLRRYGTFTGGIDLPDEKQPAADIPIRRCEAPQRLRVPLAPCGGEPAEPVVRPGQCVEAGELLARATDDGEVDVFAPLSGQVGAVVTAETPGPGGFEARPALEMIHLDTPRAIGPVHANFHWESADGETLRDRIAAGALVTCRRRARPLTEWIDAARTASCALLVCNVMEGQPYVSSGHRMLVEHGDQIAAALAILAKVVGAPEAAIVVDQRRTGDYVRVVTTASTHGIDLIALPHKYPIGADAILAYVLTRREVPLGGGTMDIGVAVTDAATCLALYRWVAGGLRPAGRVVTVAGPQVERPGNLYVPFGATCADLVDGAAGAVLHGGPMVGMRCMDDAVVTPTTDAVLAIPVPPAPLPSPCIRCGWCTDHCPSRLNVAALNDAFELGHIKQARRLGAVACVGCGVCSYICPARLPLAQRLKQLRGILVRPQPAGAEKA